MANVRIQIRRDYAAEWTKNNPVLASGEQGYEVDTTFMKVGDGVTPWETLAYWNTGSIQGPPGPGGPEGPQGVQGIPGFQGPPGPSGFSVNYIGAFRHSQLAGYPALQNDGATVTDRDDHLYVYDGSKWNDAGPIAIVEGPQGIPGANGRDGRDGNDGLQGDQGDDGVRGPEGKSAYEVAVDNGFVGTEQEWLDSLVGGGVSLEIEAINVELSNKIDISGGTFTGGIFAPTFQGDALEVSGVVKCDNIETTGPISGPGAVFSGAIEANNLKLTAEIVANNIVSETHVLAEGDILAIGSITTQQHLNAAGATIQDANGNAYVATTPGDVITKKVHDEALARIAAIEAHLGI